MAEYSELQIRQTPDLESRCLVGMTALERLDHGMNQLIGHHPLNLNGLFHYVGFMASTLLLGLAFLSIAVMLSVFAADRTRASGLAIGAWFFYVLVFDLLLLGALVLSGGQYGGDLFPYLLLLNPADVFRVLNVFSLDEVRSFYGLATVFPEALSHPALLGGVMLGWILAPLAIAIRTFQH